MRQNEQTLAATNGQGSGNVSAASFDSTKYNESPSSFQSLGDVLDRVIARIARRHGLTMPTARLVTEVAGLAGAAK